MKYFKNVKSFEDLKNQFKKLARENHPDVGGSVETMKEINCEYDALFPIWKDRHNAVAEPQEQTAETAESTRRQFYTEWGWCGSRYDSSLREKDICKIIRTYVKEKYPTWKFSVNCAGGGYLEHVNIALMESPVDIFDREYFKLPKADGSWNRTHRTRRDCWDMERMEAENCVYMQLHRIRSREDEPWFNDIGYTVLKDIYDFMMSFNYDDSDSQIDYFDRGFYESFNIGKWNKGFKVVPKTARVKKSKSEPAKRQRKSVEEATPEIEKKTGYTYRITKGEDTRDGSELWVVRIEETLDKEAYIAESKRMKEIGGYYSKFKRGFLFRFDPTEKIVA